MKEGINNSILSLINKTPDSLMQGIADRVRQRRLEKDWTQKALAAKSGVTLSSYRRFETTGEISLRSLIMIAFALDKTEDFETLFANRSYRNIDDILEAEQTRQRKRGRRDE